MRNIHLRSNLKSKSNLISAGGLVFLLTVVIGSAAGCGDSDSSQNPEAHEQSGQPHRTVDAEGGLRIRHNPGTEAGIKGAVPHGARVRVLREEGEKMTIGGRTGRWVYISYEGEEGYVFGGFLKERAGNEKSNTNTDANAPGQ